MYQTPPNLRFFNNNNNNERGYVSEDLSPLPTGYGVGIRESDQLSVSSSSSFGGPSPRDRQRYLPCNDSKTQGGIYLPMAPLSSSLGSPASANNKVIVRKINIFSLIVSLV